MLERLTDRARKAKKVAEERAAQTGLELTVGHLLYGINNAEGRATQTLTELLGKEELNKQIGEMESFPSTNKSISINSVYEGAVREARELNHNYVGTEHLLLAIAKTNILLDQFPSLNYETVKEKVAEISGIKTEASWQKDAPVERIEEIEREIRNKLGLKVLVDAGLPLSLDAAAESQVFFKGEMHLDDYVSSATKHEIDPETIYLYLADAKRAAVADSNYGLAARFRDLSVEVYETLRGIK